MGGPVVGLGNQLGGWLRVRSPGSVQFRAIIVTAFGHFQLYRLGSIPFHTTAHCFGWRNRSGQGPSKQGDQDMSKARRTKKDQVLSSTSITRPSFEHRRQVFFGLVVMVGIGMAGTLDSNPTSGKRQQSQATSSVSPVSDGTWTNSGRSQPATYNAT